LREGSSQGNRGGFVAISDDDMGTGLSQRAAETCSQQSSAAGDYSNPASQIK
jgi:hypothetical protein